MDSQPEDGSSGHSIEQFLKTTAQTDRVRGVFELENPRLLEVRLQGRTWSKMGAMIAYHGDVNFTREGVFEHGLGTFLKKAVSGEGMSLMKMDGQGRVYLADSGKKIHLLQLNNESIFVNGNDVLAFEDQVQWKIQMMRRMAGVLAGGLFNVHLSGSGLVAITSHYEPLALRVTAQTSVNTDPNATVAWSGTLTPEIRTNVSLRTFLGRGSGESIQLHFRGEGWVLVQPFEERYTQAK